MNDAGFRDRPGFGGTVHIDPLREISPVPERMEAARVRLRECGGKRETAEECNQGKELHENRWMENHMTRWRKTRREPIPKWKIIAARG